MLRYELFGRVILFEDAAERSYDLQAAAERACLEASHRFNKWYTQRGSIQAVLDGYLPFTRSTIEELAFHPLFSQLAGCEIYDVSEDTYWDRCVSLEGARAALEVVEHQYDAILDRQNAEKAQRTDRKANRSHYRSYTSFHSDAWLHDQAAAGVKNLASFTGHTLWNTVGNAGSAISASIDKNALYKDTAIQNDLLDGILTDLFTTYSAHTDLLNERREGYVHSVFDEDRSAVLFENAKKVPEKQQELLAQAFALCPWNEALVQYIFVHFPAGRRTAYAAAQRFSVDLSDAVEEILAQEYDETAQSSEAAAQAAKERILLHMEGYGISESPTLDRLETDCLERLCEGWQTAGEAACEEFMEALRQYPAQEKLKGPFFEQLQKRIWEIWTEELTQSCLGYETADEAACESFITAIKAHRTPDGLKAPFLQKVQARIEQIWSAEDGEIFDDLYKKVDITDPKAVAEAIAYVRSKGRTGSSQKYLDALSACTAKNIEKAHLYRDTNRYKLYILLAVLSILASLILPIAWIAAIPLFILARDLKKTWMLLTIGGTVIHPALRGKS